MFPIRDANRTRITPHVNHILIILNVTIFLVMFLSDLGLIQSRFIEDIGERFAMPPYYIIRGQRLHTLITSMFIHASPLHLFGNLLYLYIFGDNVEDAFRHAGYVVFYITCGLIASLSYILTTSTFLTGDLVIGASGAISGVLGAYLVLYPKARILTLIFPIIVPLPAIIFLGFWFLMQWFYAFFEAAGNVAWWAHIGGFIAGIILALAFGRKKNGDRDEYYSVL